jgi:hypothetical protein
MPIFNIYLSSNMDNPTIVQSEGKDRIEAITSYIRHYIDSNEADTPLRGIEFCFQAEDPVCEQIVFEPSTRVPTRRFMRSIQHQESQRVSARPHRRSHSTSTAAIS